MTEGCGAFAVLLAKYLGGEIYILSNKDGEPWSRSIPYEVTHVVAVKDGIAYDITGATSKEKIANYFKIHTNDLVIKGPYNREQFSKKFMGTNDRFPLYPVDSQIKQEVTTYITQNKNIFKKA